MMSKSATSKFLFSVDLENVYSEKNELFASEQSMMHLCEQYSGLLDKNGFKATFFVVGEYAKRYPNIVRYLYSKGHEIACHSNSHQSLTDLTENNFRKDLEDNIYILRDLGVQSISGYRAPFFSLVKDTQWVYSILADYGIRYSSSVMPVNTLTYHWKEFGEQPKKMQGVLEIPISVYSNKLIAFPFSGGVYFRLLPNMLLLRIWKKLIRDNRDVVSYFHPYDIDVKPVEGEGSVQFSGIGGSRLMNHLMYINRASVIEKLAAVSQLGAPVVRYVDYMKSWNDQSGNK